jgi:hypothetical protein
VSRVAIERIVQLPGHDVQLRRPLLRVRRGRRPIANRRRRRQRCMAVRCTRRDLSNDAAARRNCMFGADVAMRLRGVVRRCGRRVDGVRWIDAHVEDVSWAVVREVRSGGFHA